MKLDQYLIAIILASLILVVGIGIIWDVNTNYAPYGAHIDDEFSALNNTARSVINTSTAFAGDMKEKSFGEEVTTLDALNTVIRGSFSAVRLVTSSFKMINDLVFIVADRLGVPDIFLKILIAVITIMVVFAVIRIFTRAST